MLAYYALISSFIPFKLYIGYNRHCKKLISMIDPLKFVIARFWCICKRIFLFHGWIGRELMPLALNYSQMSLTLIRPYEATRAAVSLFFQFHRIFEQRIWRLKLIFLSAPIHDLLLHLFFPIFSYFMEVFLGFSPLSIASVQPDILLPSVYTLS